MSNMPLLLRLRGRGEGGRGERREGGKKEGREGGKERGREGGKEGGKEGGSDQQHVDNGCYLSLYI